MVQMANQDPELCVWKAERMKSGTVAVWGEETKH